MKNWLKKFIPSIQSIKDSRTYKELKSFFNAPCFWSRDQQSVARGVAAGLAAAVVPGLQFFYAAFLVFFLRGNLPIAILATLVSNPLTFVPITYFIYYIGTLIIGNGKNDFVIREFNWDFSSFYAFWSNVSAWGLQFGKAYLIGLPVVSLCLGIIGYFAVILFWEVFILLFHKKKK